MRPRPIIPSCMTLVLHVHSGTMVRADARRGGGGEARVSPLEHICKLMITPGDLGNGLIACRLFAPPSDQRIPENRAADRKSDETRDSRRDFEPFAYFPSVRAATENDAADIISPAGAGRRCDALAILAPFEPFDFPQIRFDAAVLELLHGFHHQARPQFCVVRLPVAFEHVELHLLWRNQQLEHEAASAMAGEEIGQPLQACRLSFIQWAIAIWVVTYQHFAECRIERFNVTREILAIFKVEFGLSAFLRRTGGDNALGGSVAQDGGTELFVDKNACLFSRYAVRKRGQEAFVDDLFGAGDLPRLRIAQGRLPAKQFGLERVAMIERQNVEGTIVSSRHQAAPLSLR